MKVCAIRRPVLAVPILAPPGHDSKALLEECANALAPRLQPEARGLSLAAPTKGSSHRFQLNGESATLRLRLEL